MKNSDRGTISRSTNAGHITYVELDGDPNKNLQAFEQVIRTMKESGIGYGSVNHPVDRDPVCGYNGIIDDECPGCGEKKRMVRISLRESGVSRVTWLAHLTDSTMPSGRRCRSCQAQCPVRYG